jgi:hypothetical protein
LADFSCSCHFCSHSSEEHNQRKAVLKKSLDEAQAALNPFEAQIDRLTKALNAKGKEVRAFDDDVLIISLPAISRTGHQAGRGASEDRPMPDDKQAEVRAGGGHPCQPQGAPRQVQQGARRVQGGRRRMDMAFLFISTFFILFYYCAVSFPD